MAPILKHIEYQLLTLETFLYSIFSNRSHPSKNAGLDYTPGSKVGFRLDVRSMWLANVYLMNVRGVVSCVCVIMLPFKARNWLSRRMVD